MVADYPDLDLIALRASSPNGQQRHHDEHPDAAADALHAKGLAFEIARALDFWRDGKITIKLIDHSRHQDQIEAA